MQFFSEPDNFNGILEDILGPVSLARINTGWTNFVFDVEKAARPAEQRQPLQPSETVGRNYIARFPRGACFSRAMVTDVEAVRFLRQVTDIKTTDINLYYDRSRPFSLHRKIPGRVLSSFNLEELPPATLDSLAKSIAEFFTKLHGIRAPKTFHRPLSSFLREVMGEVPLYKDYKDIELLEKAEAERQVVPVHGDLNVGNIIVNDNFEIVAFIDFAFFSVSVPETDLARMICRISEEFFEKIAGCYERFSGRKLDKALLEQQKTMWNDIERYYIQYMSQVMPDIVVL